MVIISKFQLSSVYVLPFFVPKRLCIVLQIPLLSHVMAEINRFVSTETHDLLCITRLPDRFDGGQDMELTEITVYVKQVMTLKLSHGW